MSMESDFESGQFIKPSINIGAGFDIMNGTNYVGGHGEYILSGGLSYLMGIVGKGNLFKSTIFRWMFLTAMARMFGSTGVIYDTELNISENKVMHEISFIRDLLGTCLLTLGRLTITDKSKYSGNKFFDLWKTWMDKKKKDKKNFWTTPFIDRDGKSLFKMLIPTFNIMDTISEFDTDNIQAIRDKTELGDADANMIHVRAGLVKTNFLMEVPALTVAANNYMGLVAQIGKNNEIGNSPHAPPPQQLRHLPSNVTIKGATSKFTFATHDCWYCESSSLLLDSNKEPMYPRSSGDNARLDADLVLIKLKQLRSKGGQSGLTWELICSQTDGVLPELTAFHFLRERKLWGFEGSDRNYNLALYPEVTLTRPTVRAKLNEDAKLRRAMHITMEMKQMEELWHHLDGTGILCTPKELYDDLVAKGYDWNILLNTRTWWTIGSDKHLLPFLSTMDLLRMRVGKYHPYWLEDDKKTIKKKFYTMENM